MQSFNIVWERALKYLQESLLPMDYQAFIKDLKPVMLKDGALCFEVSNDYHRQIMLDKYEKSISPAVDRAYEEIYGKTDEPITTEFLLPREVSEITGVQEKIKAPEIKKEPPTIRLNPAYTFETFVVGGSNSYANAAAYAVAKEPGKSYNPLFLYGGVGLGKTHLLHAIGNKILADNPNTDIMYVTCETFFNDLVRMITLTNNNANIDMREQFRNKYRTVDVLMIDDIQFIAGKDKTQEEFFHTFNDLNELGKQIIITSDRPPNEMEKLEERIRSRFEWGMTADIKPPDYETRVAILIKKVELKNLGNIPEIDTEVYHYIASQENTNIRTLEGALHRVMMYAEHFKNKLNSDKIGIETAKKALEDYFPPPKNREITPKIITDAVCRYYKISEKDITGSKKSRDIAFPRQIAMYMMREHTGLSLKKIADYFGKRDHTTIIYAEKQIKKLLETDSALKNEVEDITSKIKG